MKSRSALKAFGKKVKEYREASGLSQEAFAERAGISREGISFIERGIKFCSIEMLTKLSETLRVNMEDFFVSTPRVRKSGRAAAADAAVARFRELVTADKVTADDVAALLASINQARKATTAKRKRK